jgi:hypothetical protein
MPSHRTVLLFAIAALACAGGAPAATALTIASSANASDGWRSIAPVGNLEGLPLANVGLAWEADHVGWNTSITFDDSDAAGWHTPFPRDLARYGSISINSIWADDPQLSGDTPAYSERSSRSTSNPHPHPSVETSVVFSLPGSTTTSRST